MNFYAHYPSMLATYFKSFFDKFFLCSPVRPMALLLLPATAFTLKFLVDAIISEADDEEPAGKRM